MHHPIWDYIKSMQSGYRSNKAPAGGIEKLQQLCVVGFVLAYQQAADCERSAALRAVLASCRSNDFQLKGKPGKRENDKVDKWVSRSLNDPGSYAFCNSIRQMAEQLNPEIPLLDRILIAGRDLVWTSWSTGGGPASD
jgi:hypothetical protein